MDKLELLTVYQYPRDKKIRLGSDHDGGYVIACLDEKYDCYISAGVAGEESFTRDFLKTYDVDTYDCYGFDGTINNYPYQYTTNLCFVRKNIGETEDANTTNLKNLIKRYNNIFLKIDIEGGEYPWINSLTEEELCKFKQIVIEFHGINDDSYGQTFEDKYKIIKKLIKNHYIIHAHGNNYGGYKSGYHANIPDVIELTLVRKDDVGVLEKNSDVLPISGLDMNNNPANSNDISLIGYPFVTKK